MHGARSRTGTVRLSLSDTGRREGACFGGNDCATKEPLSVCDRGAPVGRVVAPRGGRALIAVTQRAKEELMSRLSRGTDAPGLGVRLASGTPGTFELLADQPRDEDQVVEHEGLNVLLVEKEISDMLDGATLDYRHTDAGLRFVICE